MKNMNSVGSCRACFSVRGSLFIGVALFLICLNLHNPFPVAGEEMEKGEQSTVTEDVFVPQTLQYLIGPEDILEISVWKNPDLSKVVTVRPDGMLSLPLIGDVKAAGITPNRLRDVIVEKLKEYQESVVVSVILLEINSYKIFILGAVVRPGSYVMKRRTTLLQAIALAGGFNQYASKKKIVVIRERAYGHGSEEKIRVSFDDAVDVQKGSEQNLILRPGDTIFVP